MQKLISLLLIASLVCSCGTKRTPYSETVEMNEIVDKQKELYEQDIKALEERNANLLKELEKAYQKPEPEAKLEKKGMGWAKAFGVSVGIVASIAAIIGIATYIGGYVNRYQAVNVTPEGAVRVTVYDYWKMWERFGIRPRLQRLAWQWDNTYVAVWQQAGCVVNAAYGRSDPESERMLETSPAGRRTYADGSSQSGTYNRRQPCTGFGGSSFSPSAFYRSSCGNRKNTKQR